MTSIFPGYEPVPPQRVKPVKPFRTADIYTAAWLILNRHNPIDLQYSESTHFFTWLFEPTAEVLELAQQFRLGNAVGNVSQYRLIHHDLYRQIGEARRAARENEGVA